MAGGVKLSNLAAIPFSQLDDEDLFYVVDVSNGTETYVSNRISLADLRRAIISGATAGIVAKPIVYELTDNAGTPVLPQGVTYASLLEDLTEKEAIVELNYLDKIFQVSLISNLRIEFSNIDPENIQVIRITNANVVSLESFDYSSIVEEAITGATTYTDQVAATKQNNLVIDGATAGLVFGGTTGTLAVNKASVHEVLTDIVDGSTPSVAASNEIVTADNLRGALSVGQAVDVSCNPAAGTSNSSGWLISLDNGETWSQLQQSDWWKTKSLVEGTVLVRYNAGDSAQSSRYFGFNNIGPHPKYATGLRYLFIFDFKNTGDALSSAGVGGTVPVSGMATIPLNAHQTEFKRLGVVGSMCQPWFSFAANTTITFEIKNWRQYEVTALTDEAIAYIAQLPDPDAFFRSTSAYSIRDKYLIKQDMVCPWIPTINMPDNSDMTVGAGLSYKIKYTKTGTYSVSVDTIPTEAYGWDAHIQMFVKDTAIVQFQAPLILMDALTPNSGHNLSVKFRNGNALVYVDDTNAGTMVYLAAGTTTTVGSLPYALSQTPSSEDATFTNFVVFSPVLGGTVCSMGVMSDVGYSASLIGNGDDETIIGGTIGLAFGKYLAVQDVNLKDFVITSGTLSVGTNVKVTGTTTAGITGSGTSIIKLENNCLLDFSDQTNPFPITGSSISSVTGAKVIVPGGTESQNMSTGNFGTGNVVTNYGKIGYPVTVVSGTVSHTLYDALVGGGSSYANIVFDSTLPSNILGVAGTTVSRAVNIIGNGTDVTILGDNDELFTVTSHNKVVLQDVRVHGHISGSGNDSSVQCKNVLVKDYTTTGQIFANGYPTGLGTCNGVTVTNCTASQIGYVTKARTISNAVVTECTLTTSFQNGSIANCVFSNNTINPSSGYNSGCCFNAFSTTNIEQVTNCVFERISGGGYAIKVGNSPTNLKVIDSTFDDTARIGIDTGCKVTFHGTIKLDSTVDGKGSVVFADGATITSTIPSGGTVGTGSFDLTNYPNDIFYAYDNNKSTQPVFSGLTFENKSGSLCIFASWKPFTIEDCLFTNNICNNKASCIAAQGGSVVTINRCYFIDNDQPVGFVVGNSRIVLKDCVFSGSTSQGYSANWGTDVGSYALGDSTTASGTLDIIGGNTFGGSIVLNRGWIINISGTNVFKERIRTKGISMTEGDASTYATLRIVSGSVIDMSENQQSFHYINISVGHYEEDTWVVGNSDTASVIPYGGGTAVSISGSGTQLSNAGILSTPTA